MGHRVNHVELSPLPKAEVTYEPTHEILFIENGKPSETAEEMARQVVVYYDKEDGSDVVAIRGDSAEVVLRPFLDAVLAKHGIAPDQNAARQPHKKGYRETLITQIQQVEWELAPYSEATYDSHSQTLFIENGASSEACKEMARDVHILYGKDDDNPPWWSAVAIRIDRADIVLKPFVDALLAKYGIRQDMNSKQPEQESSND